MDFRKIPIAGRAIQKLLGETTTTPYDDEWLALARERDQERNASTTPPPGECIDLHCIWAVEFYTPTHIDGLVKSLKNLGVGTETDRRLSRDPISWLRRQRSLHRSSGWFNLGFLKPVGSPLLLGVDPIVISLPDGVKYATWTLFSLSPSLTCIVVSFVFDEERATMLESVLRATYQTGLEPLVGGSTRIHHPDFQKRDRVDLVRKENSELCMKWFKGNIPGLFCSGLLEGQLPTCELIFLKEAEPFPLYQEGQGPPPLYLQHLGLDAHVETWESASINGLKFKPSDRRNRYTPHHSILAICEGSISNAQLNHYEPDEKHKVFNSLNMSFPNILNLWAINSMLEGYTRHLGRIRDSASFRHRNTIETLDTLSDSVSFSLDVSAVTADLISSAKSNFRLFEPIEKFTMSGPKPGEPETLHQALFATISEEAKRLRKMDTSIRNHLTQFGSLLAAKENIQVQLSINNLTKIILAAAVAIPILTWLLSLDADQWKGFGAWAWNLWPW